MIAEKSNQELRDDRALDYFQNIVETVREPLVILDSDLRVEGASRSYYNKFKVTKEETEGRLIYELGDRQWDIPALRTLLEEVLAERTQFDHFEVVHEFPRVGRRVILLNARRIISQENQANTILLAIEDITDRKRAEERLRVVVEASPSAMVMMNEQGRINLVNAETEHLFGYERAELLNQPLEILVPERYRAAHPGHRQLFAQNPSTRTMGAGRDLYGLRKDGSEVPIEIGLNPIRTDEGAFVLASIIDITERKREEQVLRDSEERLRVVIEASPSAMVMMNEQGCITLVNSETEHLFGYERAELLNHPVEMLVPERYRAVHPGHRQMFSKAPTARTMGAGRDLYGLRKNGSEVPIEIGLNPIHTDEGAFVLASIIDITDRKRIEEKLKLYAEKLQRSNDELQDFAQVASHDLQEPLRKILAFGDRLKAKAGESLDLECCDYLQRMFSAANRMQTLITDLMAFSRVETKGQPFVKTDLGLIAREVSADLETSIEKAGGRVEIEELPTIDADPMQMRQLLQNLIGNSLKYYRAGVPPIVRVYSQKPNAISPRSLAESAPALKLYQILVADNGIGFDEKYLDRIFTVFQRLHTKGEYEGTGVGLAICRKIVGRHHGTITAQSKPGEGATFLVTLPVTQSERVEALSETKANR